MVAPGGSHPLRSGRALPPGCNPPSAATAPWAPTAVAVAGRDVYVLEYLHTPGDDRREWIPRVRKIAANGAVSTLAASTRTRQ